MLTSNIKIRFHSNDRNYNAVLKYNLLLIINELLRKHFLSMTTTQIIIIGKWFFKLNAVLP